MFQRKTLSSYKGKNGDLLGRQAVSALYLSAGHVQMEVVHSALSVIH